MIQALVFHLSKVKQLFFVSFFTALAVATPAIFHFFGGIGAGRTFLPMHIFILTAGLVLGWRAGLAVGVLTPLLSHSITSMPALALLPFILIEASIYGLFSGWLRQEMNLGVYPALVGAMVAGRIFLMLSIWLLPANFSAFAYVVGAIKAGWIGILIQLALVPFVVKAINNFLRDERI